MLEVALIIINSKQACNFLKLQTNMLFSTLYTDICCCFGYTLLIDNPTKQKGIYSFSVISSNTPGNIFQSLLRTYQLNYFLKVKNLKTTYTEQCPITSSRIKALSQTINVPARLPNARRLSQSKHLDDYTPKLESAVDEGMKINSNLLPY